MRFDTSDIARAVETIQACTTPLDPDMLPPALTVRGRLRTAVGTTPPVLRPPEIGEISDGVPIETDEGVDDGAWLDLIEV